MRRALPVVLLLLALAVPASARAAVRTVTLSYGPIAVDAYSVRYRTSAVPAPDVNGFITSMHAIVTDARGNPLPVQRMMLHHVTFVDLGRPAHPKRDLDYCPGRPGRRFYGTGEEDETLELPTGYGYKTDRGDRWEAAWMLMNHGPARDSAYITYTMTIDDDPSLVPVRPHWVGVTNCNVDPIFDVPGTGLPGSVHRETTQWRAPQDGRIVAVGAHLHGGSYGIALRQPACGNRLLAESKPIYGEPDHPYYHVLPVLHEPGPIGTSWTTSSQGVPIHKGDRLRLTAFYDASRMHVRAMGIMHVYVAPPVSHHSTARCPTLPADAEEHQQHPGPYRTVPPEVTVPLTAIGPDGLARTIDRPPGRTISVGSTGTYTVNVDSLALHPGNLSVRVGTRLRWRFDDLFRHDITVADGPFGFSSQPLAHGATFTRTLTRPGVYRLFCSLHPVLMTERITVRG